VQTKNNKMQKYKHPQNYN